MADSRGPSVESRHGRPDGCGAGPGRLAGREEVQLPDTRLWPGGLGLPAKLAVGAGVATRFPGDLPGAAPRNRRSCQSVAGLGSDLPFERADVDPGVRQRLAVGRGSDFRRRPVHVLPRGLAQRGVACPGRRDRSGQPVLDRHWRHDLASRPDVSGFRGPAAASSGLGADAGVRGFVRQLPFLPAAPQRPVAQRPRHRPGPGRAGRRSPASAAHDFRRAGRDAGPGAYVLLAAVLAAVLGGCVAAHPSAVFATAVAILPFVAASLLPLVVRGARRRPWPAVAVAGAWWPLRWRSPPRWPTPGSSPG